jgi:hypothetical protein
MKLAWREISSAKCLRLRALNRPPAENASEMTQHHEAVMSQHISNIAISPNRGVTNAAAACSRKRKYRLKPVASSIKHVSDI